MPQYDSAHVDFSKSYFRTEFDSFHKTYTEEPHFSRRSQILKKYPQIKQLYTKDRSQIFYLFLYWSINLVLLSQVHKMNSFVYYFCAYLVSAALIHMIYIINHDLSHFTAFHSIPLNQLCSVFCSLSTGVPYGISFGKYHREHHKHQGIQGLDTDLASTFEIKYFKGPISKVVFILMVPFFYAIRPMLVTPLPLQRKEVMEMALVVLWDIMLYNVFGWEAMKYLLLATYFSLSVHPFAIHFIAEHFEFLSFQETYSYYGSMNFFLFNVGYHNEHHDFPMVPWYNLPKLHEIAKEFYQMPYYTSYWKVWYYFVTNKTVGAWSRVIRPAPKVE